VFLMVSTRGRLLVLGGNHMHGSDTLDSRMGPGLWDLSLGQEGACLFIRADGSPPLTFKVIGYVHTFRAGASSKDFLSNDFFKACWEAKVKEGCS
jgi:hypothetical protein